VSSISGDPCQGFVQWRTGADHAVAEIQIF
jgi:hypothetical protein